MTPLNTNRGGQLGLIEPDGTLSVASACGDHERIMGTRRFLSLKSPNEKPSTVPHCTPTGGSKTSRLEALFAVGGHPSLNSSPRVT